MRTNISYIITISLFLSLPSSIARGQAYTYDKDFKLETNVNGLGIIYGMYEEEHRLFIFGLIESVTDWATDYSIFLYNKDGSRNYSFKRTFGSTNSVSDFRITEDGFARIKLGASNIPILFGSNGESPFDFPEGIEFKNNVHNIEYVRNTHTAMLLNENRFGVILPDGSYINTMNTNQPFWTEDSIHYQDTAKEISIYKILPDGKFDSVVFQHKINKGMPYQTANLQWGITTFNDTDLYIAGLFENYDGYPIRNLLKINTNGELDTTFKSIITSGIAFPIAQMEDGRVLLSSNFGFTIEGYPNDVFSLIRVHPDGSLDTLFNMLKYNYNDIQVLGACLSQDGGFIANVYLKEEHTNIWKDAIVKIQHDGTIDKTAFEDSDFGHEYNSPGIPSVITKVQRSLDGQYYYVMGNFVEYNGEPVPKIIRFKSETFSTKEENKIDFSLFPNPTSDFIHLKLENTENVNYRITDITGKTILQNTWNGNPISIANLNSGVYLITLYQKNELLGTQKWIKN